MSGNYQFILLSGNDTHVLVMFSVEVNSGSISTNLPAELIVTTELKLINSYQWQPLQTFVTISKHFKVKAKGIRFRGTVHECNSVLQQLSYHVSSPKKIKLFLLFHSLYYGSY